MSRKGLATFKWRKEEDESLRQQFRELGEIRSIRIPGRTTTAIGRRLRKLNIIARVYRKPWAHDDEDLLRQFYEKASISSICIPGRTLVAIRQRLFLLGVRAWSAEKSSASGSRSGHHTPFSEAEIQHVEESLERGIPVREIKLEGRKPGAAYRIARRHNLIPGYRSSRRWSEDEVRSLCEQVRRGVPINQIQILGRTQSQIKQKARVLRILPRVVCRWTREEDQKLKDLVGAGCRPTPSDLPGRSKAAITNRLCALKLTNNSLWSIEEQRRLATFRRRPVGDGNNPVMKNRNPSAVSRKAQRLGLSNKEAGKKSQEGRLRAALLMASRCEEFEEFLRVNRLRLSAKEIGRRFGVGPTFVRKQLRRLGILPTWHDLLNRPGRKEWIGLRVRAGKANAGIEMLVAERSTILATSPGEDQIPCMRCGESWPRMEKFFLRVDDSMPEWKKLVRSRICRRCYLNFVKLGERKKFDSSLGGLYHEAKERLFLEAAEEETLLKGKGKACPRCGRVFPRTRRFFPISRRSKITTMAPRECRICQGLL